MSIAPPLTAIPHRPPFLFIDEVVETEDRRLVARKYLDPQADFFRGHYPGNPIMPGVLLCECCLQAGALLAAQRGHTDSAAGVPVVTRIQDARFKHMVSPGDTLLIEVVLDEELDNAMFFTARLTVKDKLVLRMTFAVARVVP